MEEQPVALATIRRSPDNCVSNLTYGVSPQPEHAPEYSKSGSRNCVPLTSMARQVRSGAGRLRKNSKLTFSCCRKVGIGIMLIAFCFGSVFDFTGQTATHSVH